VFFVKQRNDYPANHQKLQSLLSTLGNLSITQAIEAGETYNDRFGINTSITLKDSQGSTIRQLHLGKEIISGQQQFATLTGQSNAKGSYLRLPEDLKHVYAVNTPITGASPNPRNWLSEEFLEITKITSITLSKPGSEETDWHLARTNSRLPFSLSGSIPEGKEPDTSIISNLNNQFSYANFEDILTAPAAKGLSDNTKTRRAVIQTEEGFTYTIDISPKTVKGTENRILTFTVEENFPTERPRPAAETVEEGKSADEFFAQELIDIKQRYQQIKALEGNYYEVSNFTVENLMKSRNQLLKNKEATNPQAPSGFTPPLRPPGQ